MGDLGPTARNFIDFLRASGQSCWQVLPLGPPGQGNSPYMPYSAFAGSELLISPELLVEQGLLEVSELEDGPEFPAEEVNYSTVHEHRNTVLRRAFFRFASSTAGDGFKNFIRSNPWVEDYALFMALKSHFGGREWSRWERPVVEREKGALAHYRDLLEEEVDFHRFLQYEFRRQWSQLRAYANERGIRLIGDMPIYVALDSCDVWANQHLFRLESDGRPEVVAGVPPDYFSSTGQVWGNPLYRWSRMKEEGYAWWRRRFAVMQETVDLIRLDHFRGFEAYWEVPAGAESAADGRWVGGPGIDFFHTVEAELGRLPLIAEDLGFITEDVKELKEELGYPGMKVLQFAVSDRRELVTALTEENLVLYTGTHDNDTLYGWLEQITGESDGTLERLGKFIGPEVHRGELRDLVWTLIEAVMRARARICVLPLQDVLGLGSEARMNVPGTAEGNWRWRFQTEDVDDNTAVRLKRATASGGRVLGQGRF